MNETNTIELIRQYKELLDAGAITQEEYDRKKAELLSGSDVPSASSAAPAIIVTELPTGEGEYCDDDEDEVEYDTPSTVIVREHPAQEYWSRVNNEKIFTTLLILGISFGILFLLSLLVRSSFKYFLLVTAIALCAAAFTKSKGVKVDREFIKRGFISTYNKVVYGVLMVFVTIITLATIQPKTSNQGTPYVASTGAKTTYTNKETISTTITTTQPTKSRDEQIREEFELIKAAYISSVDEEHRGNILYFELNKIADDFYEADLAFSIDNAAFVKYTSVNGWKEITDNMDNISKNMMYHYFDRDLDEVGSMVLLYDSNDTDHCLYRSYDGKEYK